MGVVLEEDRSYCPILFHIISNKINTHTTAVARDNLLQKGRRKTVERWVGVGSVSCPRGRFVLQLCLKTFVARVQKLFSPPPHIIFIVIIINITNPQLCSVYIIILRYAAVPKRKGQNRPRTLTIVKYLTKSYLNTNGQYKTYCRSAYNIIVNSNNTYVP